MNTSRTSFAPTHRLAVGASLLLAGILGGDAAARPRQAQGPQAEAKPQRLVSLVLLLTQSRTLDAATVAHAVSHASGSTVPENAVAPHDHSFVVSSGSRKFAVHSMSEPYFEEVAKLVSELNDPAIAAAVRKHRAWLSVDWIENDERADLRTVYQQIGQIAAELIGPDTLAVYSPDTDQFHINNPTLVGHLKSDDPLQDLAGGGAEVADAKVTIQSDDPRLVAAEAEARKRWPEFVHAFNERKEGQYFAVKGRILEGNLGEYLWLQVSGLDDGSVHGKLDNDPATLKKVLRGADLHIAIGEVDDWLYSTGSPKGDGSAREKVEGGFTLRLFDQFSKTK